MLESVPRDEGVEEQPQAKALMKKSLSGLCWRLKPKRATLAVSTRQYSSDL
jgi:hypothetical protein